MTRPVAGSFLCWSDLTCKLSSPAVAAATATYNAGDSQMLSTLRPPARLYTAGVSITGLAVGTIALFLERNQVDMPISPGASVTVLEMTGFLLVFAALTSLAPVQISYGVNLLVNLAPTFAAVLILPRSRSN